MFSAALLATILLATGAASAGQNEPIAADANAVISRISSFPSFRFRELTLPPIRASEARIVFSGGKACIEGFPGCSGYTPEFRKTHPFVELCQMSIRNPSGAPISASGLALPGFAVPVEVREQPAMLDQAGDEIDRYDISPAHPNSSLAPFVRTPKGWENPWSGIKIESLTCYESGRGAGSLTVWHLRHLSGKHLDFDAPPLGSGYATPAEMQHYATEAARVAEEHHRLAVRRAEELRRRDRERARAQAQARASASACHTSPVPALVYVHGKDSGGDDRPRQLRAEGFLVVEVHELDSARKPSLSAIQAAGEQAKALPCVNPKAVFLMGQGYGASLATEYLSAPEFRGRIPFRGAILSGGHYPLPMGDLDPRGDTGRPAPEAGAGICASAVTEAFPGAALERSSLVAAVHEVRQSLIEPVNIPIYLMQGADDHLDETKKFEAELRKSVSDVRTWYPPRGGHYLEGSLGRELVSRARYFGFVLATLPLAGNP